MKHALFCAAVLSCVYVWTSYRNVYNGLRVVIMKNVSIQIKCTIRVEPVVKHDIPLVIYRTWRSRQLPIPFQLAWNETQRNNPNIKQVLFADGDVEDFMSTTAPHIQATYYKINSQYGAARADVFRYALLYSRGGIYLDIKSIAVDNIAQTLFQSNDSFVISKWKSSTGQLTDFCNLKMHFACKHGEYQQWWMASAPGHAILERVLERVTNNINAYTKKQYPAGKPSVLRLTGPTAYTIAIDTAIGTGVKGVRVVCANGNGAFVYRNKTLVSHQKTFASHGHLHYSLLKTSIVLPRWYSQLPIRNA